MHYNISITNIPAMVDPVAVLHRHLPVLPPLQVRPKITTLWKPFCNACLVLYTSGLPANHIHSSGKERTQSCSIGVFQPRYRLLTHSELNIWCKMTMLSLFVAKQYFVRAVSCCSSLTVRPPTTRGKTLRRQEHSASQVTHIFFKGIDCPTTSWA